MSSPLVSFAQNFEDVMLWRALKSVGNGFYIDVGAYSPSEHSVTRVFYDRGWRGINVEPNSHYHDQFLNARPRDINLDFAVGDHDGVAMMHFIPGTGLSTLDEGEAKARSGEGWPVTTSSVELRSLASLWAEFVPLDQPVHFLKIDVEGFEAEVLRGNKWTDFRPWIVVVEATRPLTTEPTHAAWEHILTAAQYLPAYSDGLNRFYVAAEHQDLMAAFENPPNVFDNFIRAAEVDATIRATRAEGELVAVKTSRSWRWTSLMRDASGLLRDVRGGFLRDLRRLLSDATSRVVANSIDLVSSKPALRRRFAMFMILPGVRGMYRHLKSLSRRREPEVRYEVRDLSPRARRIYDELKTPGSTRPRA